MQGVITIQITKQTEHIYRMTLPYKDIFTTVYVVKTPAGTVLFDAASFDADATEYILPMLAELGVSPNELKYIFISHNHRDHAGALGALLNEFSGVCLVSRSEALREKHADYAFVYPEDGDKLLEVLQVVTIPGHTPDSMALLDTRTHTLISGDCLQLYGIFGSGEWACNIGLPTEHFAAIEKLRTMPIQMILTAHDYHPYGYCYQGEDMVRKSLDACLEPLFQIKQMIQANPQMSDEDIVALYNTPAKLPTLGVRPVAAMRALTENP